MKEWLGFKKNLLVEYPRKSRGSKSDFCIYELVRAFSLICLKRFVDFSIRSYFFYFTQSFKEKPTSNHLLYTPFCLNNHFYTFLLLFSFSLFLSLFSNIKNLVSHFSTSLSLSLSLSLKIILSHLLPLTSHLSNATAAIIAASLLLLLHYCYCFLVVAAS